MSRRRMLVSTTNIGSTAYEDVFIRPQFELVHHWCSITWELPAHVHPSGYLPEAPDSGRRSLTSLFPPLPELTVGGGGARCCRSAFLAAGAVGRRLNDPAATGRRGRRGRARGVSHAAQRSAAGSLMSVHTPHDQGLARRAACRPPCCGAGPGGRALRRRRLRRRARRPAPRRTRRRRDRSCCSRRAVGPAAAARPRGRCARPGDRSGRGRGAVARWSARAGRWAGGGAGTRRKW